MMRCVVTGGMGFIGSHVVEALERAGYDVTVIDIREGSYGSRSFDVDVCDVEAVESIFREYGTGGVLHLAAIADARAALADPVRAARTNVSGTAGVLEAARRAGVPRVVFASSVWVYNAAAVPHGVDVTLTEDVEVSAAGGGHIYTTTKLAGELLCRDYAALHGLGFTILRYGIPYGTRMWRGLALRAFLDKAFSNEPIQVFGDGSAVRRFVHVDDIADAHVLALQSAAAKNQVYNLEGERDVSIKELATLVCGHVEGATIDYIEEPNRRGELSMARRVISADKACRELGWSRRTSIEDGVAGVVDWYRRGVAS